MNREILARRIEAFLFSEGESLSFKKLSQLTDAPGSEVREALAVLSRSLEGRGVSLIVTDNEAALAVSKEESGAVQEAQKKELSRDIGDAGLEVLAIILYRGPSTRAQIDYIRGVNTSTTLRTLLMRGLLSREVNPKDAREFLYRATSELLAHLAVLSTSELPDHAAIRAELDTFEANAEPNDHAA